MKSLYSRNRGILKAVMAVSILLCAGPLPADVLASWQLKYGPVASDQDTSPAEISAIDVSINRENLVYTLKVTDKANSYSGYLAGFRTESGNWFILRNVNSSLEWVEASVMPQAAAVLEMTYGTTSEGREGYTLSVNRQKKEPSILHYATNIASFSFYNNLNVQLPGSDILAISAANFDMSKILLKADSGKLVLVLTGNGNSTRDGLIVDWVPEYFWGERELFKKKSQSYYEKAIALMGVYMKDKGELPLFKESINELYNSNFMTGCWTIFDNDPEALDCAHRMMSVLGNTLNSVSKKVKNTNLDMGESTAFDLLPYGRDQSLFEALYGKDVNPYVSAYLVFLAKKNYPLLLQRSLKEFKDSKPNWGQYQSVTVEEGKELASAAMRFLTWGVEYSLNAPAKGPAFREGDGLYWKLLGGSPTATPQWFTKGQGDRTNNYFVQSKASISGFSQTTESNTTESVTTVVLPADFMDKLSQYQTPYSGNVYYPLPYTKNGVDSPRTFAYKMHKQRLAQIENKKIVPQYMSTKSIYSNYIKKNNNSPNIQPFLPGYSNFCLNNVISTSNAGVDALGLLTGSLAMTSYYDAIKGVLGDYPAKKLDEYYAFSKDNPLNDSNGFPAYGKYMTLSTENRFRLSAADLERCTVVIPQISQIRVGDIIMRYGARVGDLDPEQFGIVVGFTQDMPSMANSDARDYWQNVLVVSVKSGFRQVTLGTWGNSGNTFGGFTYEPENYHVRRFIKNKTTGEQTAVPGWDILDRSVGTLAVTIPSMYEQDRSGTGGDVKERWIPNTGEFLLMAPAVTFLSKAGVALDPREASGSSYEVVLVGAKDRYYDATKGDATHGNVYCNSGASFEVALVGGQTIKTLGKLKQGTNGVYYLDEGTNGVYANDGKEFYADGVTGSVGALVNGGTGLFVEKGSDGFVVAGRVDGERGFKLGIRPESSALARPGDDLLLVFALRTARKSEYLSAPATVPASDYIAVYDKKMLWRANLYISDSTNDWNDLHPWNAPPKAGVSVAGGNNPVWGRPSGSPPYIWEYERWGYNEWNRTQNPSVTVGNISWTAGAENTRYQENFTALNPGNGKQVVETILPATWHCTTSGVNEVYTDNKETNTQIVNSVMYCWGVTSSPFQYNKELDVLKGQIKKHFVDKRSDFMEENPDEPVPAYLTMMSQWNDTIAPRYDRDGVDAGHSAWENYRGYGELPAARKHRYLKADNVRQYYSSFPYVVDNSIGVDCGGLVYMSLSWLNTPYVSTYNLDIGNRRLLEIGGVNDNLFLVTRKANRVLNSNDKYEYPDLNLLVPGDVFYYSEYHVAIVQEVPVEIPGIAEAELSKIKLIEATYNSSAADGVGWGKVITTYTLNTYTSIVTDKNWYIGRIKTR